MTPTRDQAIAAAGQVMAAARAERDQLYATGGALAVAEASWRPGGPAKAEIAQRYEGWAQDERDKRSGGNASAA